MAMPNVMPDASTRKSRLMVGFPSDTKLFVKSRLPKKLKSAQELSAKGAERKRPAGEIMWRKAVVKAIRLE